MIFIMKINYEFIMKSIVNFKNKKNFLKMITIGANYYNFVFNLRCPI